MTYLIYLMLSLISKLSLETLYTLARFCNYFNIMLFNYRKKIIEKNLTTSFPEFKKKEIEEIIYKFYTFFFNNIFEIIKSINLTDKEIKDRVHIVNSKLLNRSIKNKKQIVLISSHYANWEWAFLRISLIDNINLHAVYKPLSNHLFNTIILKIRSKFRGNLIPLDKWKYFILENRKQPYSFLFISDQVPSHQKYGKRITFLNQSTLFDEGAEKTAKLLNADVFYIDLMQIQKGKYILELKAVSKKTITRECAKILENRINKKPENWLWSHNRWKR